MPQTLLQPELELVRGTLMGSEKDQRTVPMRRRIRNIEKET
jgi:hypothetical protein